MNDPRQPFDLDDACNGAMTRLSDYISRAAGQHRRAVTRSFSRLREDTESRTRHQLALLNSLTQGIRQQ